jgi:hypothetical protein
MRTSFLVLSALLLSGVVVNAAWVSEKVLGNDNRTPVKIYEHVLGKYSGSWVDSRQSRHVITLDFGNSSMLHDFGPGEMHVTINDKIPPLMSDDGRKALTGEDDYTATLEEESTTVANMDKLNYQLPTYRFFNYEEYNNFELAKIDGGLLGTLNDKTKAGFIHVELHISAVQTGQISVFISKRVKLGDWDGNRHYDLTETTPTITLKEVK